jgi:tetracycline repressor-like protein
MARLTPEIGQPSRSTARQSLHELASAGGLEDIGEFAGRTFDYHAAHPELARLLLWEGLADGPVADEANRTAHYQNKARAYAAAQRAGILDDDIDPDHLVFLIIALAAWWLAVPQLARMLTGTSDSDPAEHARRRESVVRAARRLTRPSRPEPAEPGRV